MQTIERFDFFPLTFDAQGTLASRQEFDALVRRADTTPATTPNATNPDFRILGPTFLWRSLAIATIARP